MAQAWVAQRKEQVTKMGKRQAPHYCFWTLPGGAAKKKSFGPGPEGKKLAEIHAATLNADLRLGRMWEPTFLTLASSGSATLSMFSRKNRGYSDTPCRWEVRGRYLYVFGQTEIEGLEDARRYAEQHGRRLLRSEVMGEHVIGWEVLNVTPEMMEVGNGSFGVYVTETWTKTRRDGSGGTSRRTPN